MLLRFSVNNIFFVVTNYNNTSYTELLLASIEESDARNCNVVVVDNGSEKEHKDKLICLKKKYSALIVIFNECNYGYFKGLNVGIDYVRKNFGGVEYLVVGNNDLLFPSDFVSSIYGSHDIFLRYPVVSPDITMLDGTHQNPHVISNISKVREFFYDIYHMNYYFAGLIVKLAKISRRFTDRVDERYHDIAQEIYQGYGACYILGPKFLENFENLWSPTFLMYEEFFLSRQLEEKGFKIFYQPKIKVQHYCHASTGQLPGRVRWRLSRDAHKEYRKYVKVLS